MKSKLTHVSPDGSPRMVDVSEKQPTRRTARARATVRLGKAIMSELKGNELTTRKGPVFQTAIIAGISAAKQTASLIPFCHPIGLEDCQINITVKGDCALIESSAIVTARTGVEMEAMTAATVAALTVYDMCKGLSHDIRIEEILLLEKRGGKRTFERK